MGFNLCSKETDELEEKMNQIDPGHGVSFGSDPDLTPVFSRVGSQTTVFYLLISIFGSNVLCAQEDSDWNQKLGMLDYGFTAIFAIESLLKMLDLGLFLHPGAYMRDIWNVMDISVVSCALLSFYFK